MSVTELPADWPTDIEHSAQECYARVMKTLIDNTNLLAHTESAAWVEEWTDSIGAAIILAFRIGIAWRDDNPYESVNL